MELKKNYNLHIPTQWVWENPELERNMRDLDIKL